MIVTGKITDSQDGTGLPAAVYASDASGIVIAPSAGTSADVNGKYSFDAGNAAFISAQFVGMTTQTKPVATTVDFVLGSDQTLPEIVITAAKKSNKALYIIITAAALLAAGFLIYKYKK